MTIWIPLLRACSRDNVKSETGLNYLCKCVTQITLNAKGALMHKYVDNFNDNLNSSRSLSNFKIILQETVKPDLGLNH